VICTISGVLLRFGLDYASHITNVLYSSQQRHVNSVYVDILANAIGCVIMGILVEWATEIKSISKLTYYSLTAGFCGKKKFI